MHSQFFQPKLFSEDLIKDFLATRNKLSSYGKISNQHFRASLGCTLPLRVNSQKAANQKYEIIAAIPMNIFVLQLHVVIEISNEADLITAFLAVKTIFTVVILPLLM